MSNTKRLEVFYDGECPVCRIEIDHYQKIGGNSGVGFCAIETEDETSLEARTGLSREELLGRFHVRDSETGEWHIGVDAFKVLWAQMPGWRHLVHLFRIPGFSALLAVGYSAFLAWQRRDRARRERRKAEGRRQTASECRASPAPI